MMERHITGLYYITHIQNLPSILEHGILSHNEVQQRNLERMKIYNAEIVERRKNKKTPAGDSLWDYANVYFQPRNPMLYTVIDKYRRNNIVVVKVKKTLLNRGDIFVTTGNAAHSASVIDKPTPTLLKEIARFLKIEYWKDYDGTKRKIMAECLVPKLIEPQFIECVYVPRNGDNLPKVKNIINRLGLSLDVICEPHMFFQPEDQYLLGNSKVFLARGDLFFSQMHTLTISVNTVGVMGKGLASRAKYQFPDVYVQYQDLCKSRKLVVGKPVFLKREQSLAAELAEESNDTGETGFLLFPTKQKWQEDSRLEYIVDGMQHVLNHYKLWGIKSLALPALGCGLGKLDWKDVGPIICSTAHKMDIQVCVYLPTEKSVESQYLTPEYLLR
jgi:hypothetical protein